MGVVSGMKSAYTVTVVPNHALPAGVERLMIERCGQPAILLLAESAMANWQLLRGWEREYGGAHEEIHLRAV
jgi:hypothetical protein